MNEVEAAAIVAMEKKWFERKGRVPSDLEISLALLLEHNMDVELEDVAQVRCMEPPEEFDDDI